MSGLRRGDSKGRRTDVVPNLGVWETRSIRFPSTKTLILLRKERIISNDCMSSFSSLMKEQDLPWMTEGVSVEVLVGDHGN